MIYLREITKDETCGIVKELSIFEGNIKLDKKKHWKNHPDCKIRYFKLIEVKL